MSAAFEAVVTFAAGVEYDKRRHFRSGLAEAGQAEAFHVGIRPKEAQKAKSVSEFSVDLGIEFRKTCSSKAAGGEACRGAAELSDAAAAPAHNQFQGGLPT